MIHLGWRDNAAHLLSAAADFLPVSPISCFLFETTHPAERTVLSDEHEHIDQTMKLILPAQIRQISDSKRNSEIEVRRSIHVGFKEKL